MQVRTVDRLVQRNGILSAQAASLRTPIASGAGIGSTRSPLARRYTCVLGTKARRGHDCRALARVIGPPANDGMSPERQVAHFARVFAVAKAHLALKMVSDEFPEDMVGCADDPFGLVSGHIGELAAVAIIIRFDLQPLCDALRYLNCMRRFQEAPPRTRQPRNAARPKPAASRSRQGESESGSSDPSRKLARAKARASLKAGGEALQRKVRDPFGFLAEQIGNRAATAFLLRFDKSAVAAALTMWTWMLAYKKSTPPLRQLISDMAARAKLEETPVPLVSWAGDPQVATMVVGAAMTNALLAAMTAGEDLGRASRDPFGFLVGEIGVPGAAAFFLRADRESIGASFRSLALMLNYRRVVPSFRSILKHLGAPEQEEFEELPLLTDTVQ